MSDFDNTREDRYSDRQEREEKARQESIDFHADNWMTAVTKSVEKSSGTFDDVTDYEAIGRLNDFMNRPYPKRKARSEDLLDEEMHNSDFTQRAMRILIDVRNGKNAQFVACQLFDDMAQSYAEFQYEKNIKD